MIIEDDESFFFYYYPLIGYRGRCPTSSTQYKEPEDTNNQDSLPELMQLEVVNVHTS
jgi:hypothetical protein